MLAQAEIPQNGTLSFTAKGFSPGEQVSLDGRSFAADQEGSLSGELTSTAAPGRHTLTAVTKGTLLWGFKKSFRDYVGKGSGNSITGTNGAAVTDVDTSPNSNGVTTGAHQYPFKEARYSSATQFEVAFGGTITFTYPGHFFTIHLANPKVTVKDAKDTLSADLDLATAKTTDDAGVLTITGIRSTLTDSEAFAGFYGAGNKLDDLALTLGSSCSALPEQPGPAGPPPVVQAPQDLVPPLAFRPQRLAGTGASPLVPSVAGIVLLVSGIALVSAARRRTSPGRRS